MSDAVFAFLLIDVLACACLLASLTVQLKRHAEYQIRRYWIWRDPEWLKDEEYRKWVNGIEV